MTSFREVVKEQGYIPLSWAGSSMEMNYLNWGDAMSPVMVAMVTGLPIRRVPFKSKRPRLAAVGTIAHGLSEGRVLIWGSGCSQTHGVDPVTGEPRPYRRPARTRMHVAATRGPLSAKLLGGGTVPDTLKAFGDPVWLLPRFYNPPVKKTHKLGVILHLSELADRETIATPRAGISCYGVPDDGSVRLINTVTDISVDGLRSWLDEVLACERIVSTSLHGMVVAEAYGIPCLPFANGQGIGLSEVDISSGIPIDSRLIDLYQGLGQSTLQVYGRSHEQQIDWEDLIAEIDRHWSPKQLDEDALIDAIPLNTAPISAPEGKTVFDHPAIRSITFQHDVAALRDQDAPRRIQKSLAKLSFASRLGL